MTTGHLVSPNENMLTDEEDTDSFSPDTSIASLSISDEMWSPQHGEKDSLFGRVTARGRRKGAGRAKKVDGVSGRGRPVSRGRGMARAGITAASIGAERNVAVEISGETEMTGAAVGNKSTRGNMTVRGRGTTRGRTPGLSIATRGRQAARGRGNKASLGISAEDRVRVERLQEDRRSQTQEQIMNMDPDDARRLLIRVMDREPGLIFDVLQPAAQGTEIPLQGVPGWCSCSRCREMGTDLENKCCGMIEANCISTLPHMSLYILDEHVLRLARRLRNDIYALHDTQLPGDDNREYRYAAYRNFVLWHYGALGAGNRIVIPSCCVYRIRDKYPDPCDRYTGFIETV